MKILLFIFWTIILNLISARRNAEIQRKLDHFLDNLIHGYENSSIKQPEMIVNLPDNLVDILAQTHKHGEDAQREIRDGANHLSLPYISIRGRIMKTPNGKQSKIKNINNYYLVMGRLSLRIPDLNLIHICF